MGGGVEGVDNSEVIKYKAWIIIGQYCTLTYEHQYNYHVCPIHMISIPRILYGLRVVWLTTFQLVSYIVI